MLTKLTTIRLPIDELLTRLFEEGKVEETFASMRKPHRLLDTFSLNAVTLELVRHSKATRLARSYLAKLLDAPKEYGYLYYLSSLRLVRPLEVNFNPDTIVECSQVSGVADAIGEFAKEFACPRTVKYDITRVELLYFYALLMNPQLNWVSIDYVLQGAVSHALLIAHPARRYVWRTAAACGCAK